MQIKFNSSLLSSSWGIQGVKTVWIFRAPNIRKIREHFVSIAGVRLTFYCTCNIYVQVTNAVQVIVRGMCGLLCVQIVSSISSVASYAMYYFKPCMVINSTYAVCIEVPIPPSLLCKLTNQSVASKIYIHVLICQFANFSRNGHMGQYTHRIFMRAIITSCFTNFCVIRKFDMQELYPLGA